MTNIGIVGVSGYIGVELYHILKYHKEVKVTAVTSESSNNKTIEELFPHLKGDTLLCKEYSIEEFVKSVDVVFTAVPHGGPAMDYYKAAKDHSKLFIDLSADFRLKDPDVYEKVYSVKHKYPEALKEAVYGMPELYKEKLKKTKIIASPGCYPTSSILAAYPALKEGLINPKSLIIDSKSGASGAGRKIKSHLHFSELDESFQAYSVSNHRHMPEINQELSTSGHAVSVTFVPHLVPQIRGILTVCYADLMKEVEVKDVASIYKNFYKDSPFVRILEKTLPNTKYVSGTNFIDISFVKDQNNRLIIISAIDNLIKGAAGQAVQSMNIAFGFKETEGLDLKPIFP